MSPPSSSTFSSEPSGDPEHAQPSPRRRDLREAVVVSAWTLVFLVAADLAIGRLVPMPGDPGLVGSGKFQEAIHYGWSVEAKIRRALGKPGGRESHLVKLGWLGREFTPPQPPSAGPLLISCYGMSFSNDIANAMGRLDPEIRLFLRGTPGASPNHSFAAYQRDRGGGSRVVILGILASTVPYLASTTSMTRSFEVPMAYTYPRIEARSSGLAIATPPILTADDLRTWFNDPQRWGEYVHWLQTHDAYYHAFLFRESFADASVLMRMTRRAVGQRWQTSREALTHGPDGFVAGSPVLQALETMTASFAASVRRDGKIPIVLLIEDRGFGDHLSEALGPILQRDQIASLSTHTRCPDSDPRNFAPDGHFTAQAYETIARALRRLIGRLTARDRS